MFDERPYQTDSIRGAIEALEGAPSTLGVLPTGGGKTIIFAKIIQHFLKNSDKRAIVLAHREELIQQGARKIEAVTGVRPGIEMADNRADATIGGMFEEIKRVVVASVPTLNAGPWCRECYARRPNHDEAPMDLPESCPACLDGLVRRMQRFDPKEFGLIITDEAHHSVASTYRRIYDFFRDGGAGVPGNPAIKHLGVTATADRADESALGKIFETVAFNLDILDLINDGWLVPITQQWVQVNSIDLSHVRTTAGDLNEGDLEEIMVEEESLHGVVNPTLELAGARPTLVFTASVRHAELVADIFNRHQQLSAACVTGSTSPEVRRKILDDYSRGRYQYLVGCGVFLEGFDEPRISCVAMARPTKSRPLYAQAVGRGTRPITPPQAQTAEERREGIACSVKRDLLVLDFVGNSGQHKLISTADILGVRYDDDVVEEAVAKAKEKGHATDLVTEIEEVLDRRAQIKAREAQFRLQNVDPFDVYDVQVGLREPAWHKGRKPTEAQLTACERLGLSRKRVISFFQASKILDAAGQRRKAGLATFKQVRMLGKHGIDAKALTFERAGQIIDAIAKNGWRVPEGL